MFVLRDFRNIVSQSLSTYGVTGNMMLDTYINLGYNEVYTAVGVDPKEEQFEINTTVDEALYDIPIDGEGMAIRSLRDTTNNYRLIRVAHRNLHQQQIGVTGGVVWWAHVGRQIEFYPVPTSEMTIEGVAVMSAVKMEAPDDSSDLDPSLDNAIVMMAVSYGLSLNNQPVPAQTWREQAIRYMGSRETQTGYESGELSAPLTPIENISDLRRLTTGNA